MDILGYTMLAGLAALAGCYSPTVLDCTVSCSSPHDCVSGQICGSDGLCAAPGIAGQCAKPMADASVANDAGGADGSALVSLHVQITGKGSVLVEDRDLCSSSDPQHGNCTYSIQANVPHTVQALAIQADQMFTSWTSVTCNGQPASCTFTPAAATTITAKFERP